MALRMKLFPQCLRAKGRVTGYYNQKPSKVLVLDHIGYGDEEIYEKLLLTCAVFFYFNHRMTLCVRGPNVCRNRLSLSAA